MPKYWTTIFGLNFIRHKSPEQSFFINDKGRIESKNPVGPELNFEGKIREYISLRYPFVNIVDVRDTGEYNIYEGQTLSLLHNRCKEADIDVLYIHNKGVTSASASVSNWRDILNHYCINEWPTCVKKLESVDVVGVKDLMSMNLTMSGNFWWSKSSYIQNLPEPINSDKYMVSEPHLFPGQPGYRYAFERWNMINNPSFYHIVDTKTDHFTNYCFIENLINGNETP
jgi:hypothetical protein